MQYYNSATLVRYNKAIATSNNLYQQLNNIAKPKAIMTTPVIVLRLSRNSFVSKYTKVSKPHHVTTLRQYNTMQYNIIHGDNRKI